MARNGAARQARALWLRCDLRMDDNPALQAACNGAETLLPIFVFDPANFKKKTMAGCHKSSARRARFLIESVSCMRRSLEARGSGLAVAIGKPSEVLPQLCGGCKEVFVTKGICSEETTDEKKVEKQIRGAHGCSLKSVWGGMLYEPEDTGCNGNIPLMFTAFKNKAESRGKIKNPLNAPKEMPSLPSPEDQESQKQLKEALAFMPSLEQLNYSAEEAKTAMLDDPRGVLPFQGGEEAAKQRLQKWMFDDNNLKDYFDIRNGMKGESYSSKLSPWLANGCISPRRVQSECIRYEKETGIKNKSTYWLVFELTWRDFYLHMGLSQGDKIFVPGGVTGDKSPWHGSREALEKWKAGRTGDKLVDANMRELSATGFMSNRGRQNVASYLIFDLGVDWRYGASHFEEHLLDHDPCSNWGNWVAAAGLTGQRINKFNTKKQLNDYDPRREYVDHWLSNNSVGPTLLKGKGAQSTADKLDMSLDDLSLNERSGNKGKGKGKRSADGKGGGGGKGYDNKRQRDEIGQRRWGARNQREVYMAD